MKSGSTGVILVCSMLAACADPVVVEPQQITLRTDQGEYVTGEIGRLVLENLGPRGLRVSFCQPLIERKHEGEWQSAGRIMEACTMELSPVQAGDSAERRFEIRPEFFTSEGEYRLRIGVDDRGELVEVVSSAFTVRT
jgi:hypothetical protein